MGEGATFRIYLPEHQAEAGSAAAATTKESARDLTGIGTMLLVEDEDAVRLFSARALRNKGYQVLEARSGEAALEIVGEHLAEIDLIISDVVMPRMDGPTMVKEVRTRRADLPRHLHLGLCRGRVPPPNRRRRGSELPLEAVHPEAAGRQGEGSAGAAWRAQAGSKLTN
jgi:CheY-like chemotaxis protein